MSQNSHFKKIIDRLSLTWRKLFRPLSL